MHKKLRKIFICFNFKRKNIDNTNALKMEINLKCSLLIVFFFFCSFVNHSNFFFISVAHVGDRHHFVQLGVRHRPWRVLGAEQRDANHLVDTRLRLGRDLRGRHTSARARR